MDKKSSKQLKSISHIKREIEILKEQIESTDVNMTSDKVKGSSIDFPYTLQSITITGIDITGYNQKLERLKKRLQIRLNELADLVEEIDEYISGIKDSEMRQILTLRYINNLTWQQVALRLGYADESVPRKKCDRFLKMTDKSEK